MKQPTYLHLIFLTFLFITFSSCEKDKPITATEEPAPSLDEIADIATFHGNKESNIVVINTQGGPLTELDIKTLKEIISESKTDSVFYVNVHQEQTKNPARFREADITFEQAKEADLKSVEYLKRVVDFFNMQKDKKVYVLGISFGAFMTQELIATHGTDIADGFLIVVGRLDIDEEFWKDYFSQGKFAYFDYDEKGDYSIVFGGEGGDPEDRNTARLAAGLGYNRYTKKLDYLKDLSKVTYVYGNRDGAVGALTEKELQFLKSKNTHVLVVDGGDHEDGINKAIEIMKQTFGIQ